MKMQICPGQVAQLVRAKVAGSISDQGTYKNQPVNALISGTTNRWIFFFLSLSLPLSQKKKKIRGACGMIT